MAVLLFGFWVVMLTALCLMALLGTVRISRSRFRVSNRWVMALIWLVISLAVIFVTVLSGISFLGHNSWPSVGQILDIQRWIYGVFVVYCLLFWRLCKTVRSTESAQTTKITDTTESDPR